VRDDEVFPLLELRAAAQDRRNEFSFDEIDALSRIAARHSHRA